MTARTLDHAAIAARIPHRGAMCLLAHCDGWTAQRIDCRASGHRDADHPLRSGGVLAAAAAVEYASQAMALHGTLTASAGTPQAGFLAAVRNLRLAVARLDDIAGDLHVHAERLAGDTRQALYAFALHDAQGTLLADGRATVVLDALP